MITCPACKHRFIPLSDRPRSTGRGSQSAHLHGHLQQIGRELGYSLGEIKEVMKADLLDWPHKTVTFKGREFSVPISESDATVRVEAAAIEWCHMRAAEFGIRLIENEAGGELPVRGVQ